MITGLIEKGKKYTSNINTITSAESVLDTMTEPKDGIKKLISLMAI